MNDNGYVTANSHSPEEAPSEDFDKHLEVTQTTPAPGIKAHSSPRDTRKTIVEEPEDDEEDDDDRFRFRMRAPPPNVTDALFNEREPSHHDKRRAKSAVPPHGSPKKYY